MYYFIGGYPRTGTTLVGSLLCGDPRTNDPISEVTYLEYLMFPYEAFIANWEENHRGLFGDHDEFWEFHREMIWKFLLHLKGKHLSQHLVLKRPFLTRWFPTLAQMFEDSHYLICVRDPRDVLGSLKKIKRKHEQMHAQDRAKNPYLDQSLIDLAYGYTAAIVSCLDHAKTFKDRFHFIKYEDLVTDTEESIKTISKVLGLELGLNQEEWVKYLNYRGNNPFHSRGWGKPINSSNIGKYKSQLNGEEIEMVEVVCNLIMEGFGYGKSNRNLEGGARGL